MLGNGTEKYIICTDLFKIYKVADLEVVALRGLDLVVAPGEIVAVVGASGSGKTTLLNILAGYDTPSAGGVEVGGRDLLSMDSKEVEEYRRNEIGFVWQQSSRNLFSYLTTAENISLPLLLADMSAKERSLRAEEILKLVGLSDRAEYKPAMLSGGEQQRVSIGVALSNRPSLLLADEPTGELDNATAEGVLELFDDINRVLGTTIMIVTHDPEIAHKVGRVVLIRDGKTATEIRRKVTFAPSSSGSHLEEFTLVDSAGRVQIPKQFLDSIKIKNEVRIQLEDGKLIISPGEN